MTIINPNDPSLRGGIQLQKVPVIPWEAFVACGLRVFHDEKVKVAIFAPEPMNEIDEALATRKKTANGPREKSKCATPVATDL